MESGAGTEWIVMVLKGCIVNFGCYDGDDDKLAA